MAEHLLPGDPPIAVALRRSARARRLSLRVSRLDGRVTLTLPKGVPEREGLAFVRAREDWLRGHLAGMAAAVTVGIGGQVPYLGRDLAVTEGAVRRITLTDGALILPQGAARPGTRIQAFLRAQARDALAAASDDYATALGRPYRRLTLRDTRSRWGSCTATGDLMYSWRLIMAPLPVLRYVAAHEVAHLAEMNHSPAFWDVVERLYPDHAASRRWLRSHGDRLHRVQFAP